MYEELSLRICVVSLAIAYQAVRWPTRHLTGFRAAWEAMKKNPWDGVVLSTCSALWIGTIVLYAGFEPRLIRWELPVPYGVRWIGAFLGIAAVALTRWADVTLGKNLSIIVQIKADQTLITDGPYRWIRHPIYCSTALFAMMLVLVSANLLVATGAAAAACLLLGTRIETEERLLSERFPDQYRAYQESTGRLLPRLPRRASR